MDSGFTAIFPNNEVDPLDRPDFNIAEWINKQFPNEESLQNIDAEMDFIKGQIKKLDEQIINEVSQQSKSGAKGQAALQDAKVAIGGLFEKIKDIKDKSLEADRMVKAITEDIGDLDTAKNNVTLTIRTLTQLNNIVTKIEQIQEMTASRQYSDVAHSLATVSELLRKFDEYKGIPKIERLHQQVEKLKETLRVQLFNEFQHEISTLSLVEKKNLSNAAAVIEVMGPSVKRDFISDFSQKQLGNYNMVFVSGSEDAKLEHIDRRFTWLMNLLNQFKNDYNMVFPASWKVDEVITEDLCFLTREAIFTIMNNTKSKLEPVTLQKALKKTVFFEKTLGTMFEPKSEEEAMIYKKKYNGIISKVFDEFMYINTNQQDEIMNSVFQSALDDETWEPGNNGVLESSCIIIYNFAKVRKEGVGLTQGEGFYAIFQLFDKYLKNYCSFLSKKLKSIELRPDEDSLQCACVIYNTAVYCCSSANEIETRMKEAIDQKYKEKINLQQVIDLFESLMGNAAEYLRSQVMRRLEPAFAAQSAMDWANINKIGDQSTYVTMIGKELNIAVPTLKLLNAEHRANFFVSLAVTILSTFETGVYKIRGVSELGGDQLLADVEILKGSLARVLGTGDNERATKRIDQKMSTIKKLCQVVLADREGIVSAFKNHFETPTATELVKILDIKGIPKAEQEAFLDHLGGVGKDAQIRQTIRQQAEEEGSMTGQLGSFLATVSSRHLGINK